jgi:hypothetical protein
MVHRVKVNPAHEYTCPTCKSAVDRLAGEHSTANGKDAFVRSFHVLPLTLPIVADINFMPECQVWPDDQGGSQAALRIDCLVNITLTDGSIHSFAVEFANSKREDPLILHSKFLQMCTVYAPAHAYLCVFRVSASNEWTLAEKLDIFRR